MCQNVEIVTIRKLLKFDNEEKSGTHIFHEITNLYQNIVVLTRKRLLRFHYDNNGERIPEFLGFHKIILFQEYHILIPIKLRIRQHD